jgi:NAD(P)-dependent dehydrogenase (short-subunit alcohol dehydrogenase family)
MHILMLSDAYFPRVNGVSASMRTFARDLVRRGHQVTVVAPSYGNEDQVEAFELIRLPSRRIFFDPEDRLIQASAMRRLLLQLQGRQFD